MPTHKKAHDKDKYYHLAKDQGNARVTIDLCAAPGGWCQVAAKEMPKGSLILGVDLLPIRAIRDVKTIQADITTAECRRMVVAELQGWKADVVLCDGAPNIGSSYSKDAFVQNELVLAALKFATDHLVAGGTFCSKVYRSADYNSVVWVLQQLFEEVQTVKPNSSRSQSSEIFLVCLRYTAPKKVDPKLLDPNHVFKEVEGGDPGLKKVNVLHKKYEQHNKRHRSGYDESKGPLLQSIGTVSQFISSNEPIQMLSDMTQLIFSDSEKCQQIKQHPRTTDEIAECLADLKLLGKTDFKRLLRWRQQVLNSMEVEQKAKKDEADDNEAVDQKVRKGFEAPLTEEEIQEEIFTMREKIAHQERKEKKKSRKLSAKERQRLQLGITGEGFAVADDIELFTFQGSADDIAAADVNLEEIDEYIHSDAERGSSDHSREEDEGDSDQQEFPDNEDMEDELEQDYMRYISGRKARFEAERVLQDASNTTRKGLSGGKHVLDDDFAVLVGKGDGEATTVTGKRQLHAQSSEGKLKMSENERSLLEEAEAEANLLIDQSAAASKMSNRKRQRETEMDGNLRSDLETYVRMLAKGEKKRNDNDSSSDDSSDSDDYEPENKIVTRDTLSDANKASKWFSNPIFGSSLVTGEESEDDSVKQKKGSNDEDQMELEMPKTDKQLRKEQRKKALERRERKELKAGKLLREAMEDEDGDGHLTNLKLGMGKVAKAKIESGMTFEVVPAGSKGDGLVASAVGKERKRQKEATSRSDEGALEDLEPGPLPERKDDRSYDSDHEDYDLHDRARTLALGTLMLRHSRRKALVDASYNRFAWNDPAGLPSWFQDDEMRHNKPQVPLPKALVDQYKGKFQKAGGGNKEIKKVAEARARKRKRAQLKLKAAKKTANALAENNEISEKQKLRAITKAMKSSKVDKPGKVYVVTRQTKAGSVGASSGGKKGGKLKFVDRRMRSDTRAAKRLEKKKKGKSSRRR